MARNPHPHAARAIALPFVASLLAFGAFQSFYNFRVTGRWYMVPQILHTSQYQAAPILWVMKPLAPKSYSNSQVAAVHSVEEMKAYLRLHSFPIAARLQYLLYRTIVRLPSTLQGVWMAWIVAIFLPDRRLRELALLCVSPLCFLLLETWLFPHYEAPLVPLALLLMTRVGWRIWKLRLRGQPIGRAVVAVFFLIYLLPQPAAVSAVGSGAPALSAATTGPPAPSGSDVSKDRPRVIRKLLAAGGRHVVIVRYSPGHIVHQEWVYNAADIDASPIVWARDRGADNARLLDYYRGRTFWLLQPDVSPADLQPYPVP